MPVAKSYENMPRICDPYVMNGRTYVKVNTGKGEKQVRWYTEAEYARMYPEAVNLSEKKFHNQKEALGFNKGYITIFKGDTYSHLEWFRESICRYAKWWGWYVPSTEEIPEDLPKDLTTIKLDWESIANPEDSTSLSTNESKVKDYVDTLQYEPSPSQFVGNIKERLELTLKVTRAIELEGAFGISTLHIFEDENKNVFVWTTTAKSLKEGVTYHLRGTVKDHKVYRGVNQTVLTRCTNVVEVEIEDEEE